MKELGTAKNQTKSLEKQLLKAQSTSLCVTLCGWAHMERMGKRYCVRLRCRARACVCVLILPLLVGLAVQR